MSRVRLFVCYPRLTIWSSATAAASTTPDGEIGLFSYSVQQRLITRHPRINHLSVKGVCEVHSPTIIVATNSSRPTAVRRAKSTIKKGWAEIHSPRFAFYSVARRPRQPTGHLPSLGTQVSRPPCSRFNASSLSLSACLLSLCQLAILSVAG